MFEVRHHDGRPFPHLIVRIILQIGFTTLMFVAAFSQPKPPSWNQADMRRLFHPYVGRWVGEWTITDVEGIVIKRIKLQQQYWWDKGHLKGLMSFEDRGKLSSLTSDIYLQGGEIISEVVNTEERNFYRAYPQTEFILWTPMKKEDVLRRRIKESVFEKNGAIWFISEGFERFIDGEKVETLLFRVELKRVT